MTIQIVGSGCSNCARLEASARKAVADLGLEAQIEKVTDFLEIAAMGVMATPALAINGNLKSSGRVLSPAQVADILKDEI
ncbi:MAG: thioredoxin family protein [Spirochaetales bacterium]|nr:thioredoxin family protein [Spirochaetales bacterium]